MSKPKKEDSSTKISQKSKLKDGLLLRDFNWTEKQKQFIELGLNKETKIMFVNGPAGTSKTLLGVYLGLKLIHEKRVSDLLYVRTIIESASKGLGSLPGEAYDKFAPFLMPLEDKLEELLSSGDIKRLKDEGRVNALPINFVRGSSWNAKFILADECQNFTFPELTTLITRLGQFSKLIVCGDHLQSDLNGKSGFKKMFDLFNDEQSRENGIVCFEFDRADVMRSGIVKYILEKLETVKV